jgi:hypothetical protein
LSNQPVAFGEIAICVVRAGTWAVLPGLQAILSLDVYDALNWLLFSSAAKSVIIYFDFTLLSLMFWG